MHNAMHDDEQAKQPDGAKPDLARRSLLKAAPLGALAVVAGRAAAEESAPAPAAVPEPEAAKGYHETEHIRRYYRTAAYW